MIFVTLSLILKEFFVGTGWNGLFHFYPYRGMEGNFPNSLLTGIPGRDAKNDP